MEIDVVKLKGNYVYLKELQEEHVAVLKKLAKDERLWEFTKTLLINETFDQQFDRYVSIAFNPHSIQPTGRWSL
jgi:N-acetyltransferase